MSLKEVWSFSLMLRPQRRNNKYQSEFKTTVYRNRDDNANHYITDAVQNNVIHQLHIKEIQINNETQDRYIERNETQGTVREVEKMKYTPTAREI